MIEEKLLYSDRVIEALKIFHPKHFIDSVNNPWLNDKGSNIQDDELHDLALATFAHLPGLQMMEMRLQRGMSGLEIGCFCDGLMTGLMARLVGGETTKRRGHVYAVAHTQAAKDIATLNLQPFILNKQLLPSSFSITVGKPLAGLPEFGPYDVIHFGYAVRELPLNLLEQLKVGGILMVPRITDPHNKRKQELVHIVKESPTTHSSESTIDCLYPPLEDINQ